MVSSAAKLEVEPLSRLCKALGDETRIRIVALLSHGELCVCHVEDALGLSQPTASRALAVLRAAGVVARRRTQSWAYYRLAEQPDELADRAMRGIVRAFANQATLRRDIERLRLVSGPERCSKPPEKSR